MLLRRLPKIAALTALAALSVTLVVTANGPATTAFSYQGLLQDEGVPAGGNFDFEFKLFDSLTDGAQVGTTLEADDISVVNGLFTVQLDFGSVFDGTDLWLETGVREGADNGVYDTLAPRQPIGSSPVASYASVAGSLSWNDLTEVPAGIALYGALARAEIKWLGTQWAKLREGSGP